MKLQEDESVCETQSEWRLRALGEVPAGTA